MRRIRTKIKKRDKENVKEVSPVVSSLESSPFDAQTDYSDDERTPQVQAKEKSRENVGHNLADISISAKDTAEEDMAVVQAKDDSDSVSLIPEEEEQTSSVQAKEEDEQIQTKAEEDTEDLVQAAQELYEQLLAGDEAAIATLQDYGLDVESLQGLSPEEAIAQIQETLATDVSAESH